MGKLSVIVSEFADVVEAAHQTDVVAYTAGKMVLPLEERLERRLVVLPVALRNGNAADLRAKLAEAGALLAAMYKAAEVLVPEKQLSLPVADAAAVDDDDEDDEDDDVETPVELELPKGSPRKRPEVVR